MLVNTFLNFSENGRYEMLRLCRAEERGPDSCQDAHHSVNPFRHKRLGVSILCKCVQSLSDLILWVVFLPRSLLYFYFKFEYKLKIILGKYFWSKYLFLLTNKQLCVAFVMMPKNMKDAVDIKCYVPHLK